MFGTPQGDEEKLRTLLEGGGRVLAAAVNEEGRSALHFTAALGKVDATRMLCQAGAVVDAQDRDGGCGVSCQDDVEMSCLWLLWSLRLLLFKVEASGMSCCRCG